nr:collagen alpha-1(III) chain-like [Anolis sagrei ordinatus]
MALVSDGCVKVREGEGSLDFHPGEQRAKKKIKRPLEVGKNCSFWSPAERINSDGQPTQPIVALGWGREAGPRLYINRGQGSSPGPFQPKASPAQDGSPRHLLQVGGFAPHPDPPASSGGQAGPTCTGPGGADGGPSGVLGSGRGGRWACVATRGDRCPTGAHGRPPGLPPAPPAQEQEGPLPGVLRGQAGPHRGPERIGMLKLTWERVTLSRRPLRPPTPPFIHSFWICRNYTAG